MLLSLVLVIFGLALLLLGGDILVRAASALARGFGISPLVIGLTVVAFGTSAPELSVNVLAVSQGNTDISFGNIIGSNIANIGLILGICAIIRPLAIEGSIIMREIPMMLLASAVTLIAGMDIYLRGIASEFDRSDGLILLLLFAVFLFYTIGDVLRKRERDPLLKHIEQSEQKKSSSTSLYNVFMIVAGLALLVVGGKIAVDSAIDVAEALGVSSVIIALTVIAIGTSLPELATSGVATWRGQIDIAIGNVVGSNIFNLLLVNGICAAIRPIPVPAAGQFDLLVMFLLALLLLPLALSNNKRVTRAEGVLLLLLFVGFTGWRVSTA
jgi:cation:H+ antiporter